MIKKLSLPSIGISRNTSLRSLWCTYMFKIPGSDWYKIVGLDKENQEDRDALIHSLYECGITSLKGKSNHGSGLTLGDLHIFLLWQYLIGNTNFNFKHGFKIKVKYDEYGNRRFKQYRDNFKIKDNILDNPIKIVEKLKVIFPNIASEVGITFLMNCVEHMLGSMAREEARYSFLNGLLLSEGITIKRPEYNNVIKLFDLKSLREVIPENRRMFDTKASQRNIYGDKVLYNFMDKVKYTLIYKLSLPIDARKAAITKGDDLNKKLKDENLLPSIDVDTREGSELIQYLVN